MKRACLLCDGSGLVAGHYQSSCAVPLCRGPMLQRCPKCDGEKYIRHWLGEIFVGPCRPKEGPAEPGPAQ